MPFKNVEGSFYIDPEYIGDDTDMIGYREQIARWAEEYINNTFSTHPVHFELCKGETEAHIMTFFYGFEKDGRDASEDPRAKETLQNMVDEYISFTSSPDDLRALGDQFKKMSDALHVAAESAKLSRAS